MITNILQYLERTVSWLPEKRAFWTDSESLTFRQLSEKARAVGSCLLEKNLGGQPVAVLLGRSPKTIAAFFGCVCAGCFYVPLDEEMSLGRILEILETVQPGAILTQDGGMLSGTAWESRCLSFDIACRTCVREELLTKARRKQIDTDPVYLVFTSGSTGKPKGVLACHRNVIDYIEHLGPVLNAGCETVFGSQAPLYLDACLKEVMCTVKYGGSCYLIPRESFLFPVRLVQLLNEHHINTICWVPSVLAMVSGLGTFRTIVPQDLHTVAFAGEAFSARALALWRKVLPNARFINLYGPTEATGTSCYYVVDREIPLEDAIPIGTPFPNTGILLLDEQGREADAGEICIRGSCLSLGYFRDPERTAESFVRNPANPNFLEIIYRTGDYGAYNRRGELCFAGRKDAQVKHMGHRIELGEIEKAAARCPEVELCCCLYDAGIRLFYTGIGTPDRVCRFLQSRLPKYMLPTRVYHLDTMPLLPGGKTDRKTLKIQAGKGAYAYESVTG